MKVSGRVAALLANGTVEQAKQLVQEFTNEGRSQAAVDLYRCIIGNDRARTKRLDRDKLLAMAALMKEGEELGLSYRDALRANQELKSFAPGGSTPDHLPPMPPLSRY